MTNLGASGFTITRGAETVNVTVSASTRIVARGQSSPQVAAGDRVVVVGTVTSPGTLAAARVLIKAPEQASAKGTVQAIASTGTSFTIVRGPATLTVDVTSATTYAMTGGTSATFADLSVGDRVVAKGTFVTGAFDATAVLIQVPPQRAILGTVVATGQPAGTQGTGTQGTGTQGTGTQGTGTQGTGTGTQGTGTTTSTSNTSFTMTAGDEQKPVTVDVSSGTVYLEAKVGAASFSSLAAGDEVVVVGSVSDGVVDASAVVILSVPTTPPPATTGTTSTGTTGTPTP